MKFISPRVHGVIDYLVVLFLIASPVFFGFNNYVAIFTYALAIVHMILTLLTDFNAGVFKVISFALHGWIELVVGITLVIFSFTLFKDAPVGKPFYLYFGIAVLLVWLFTDYKCANISKS